jgi:hypothetical protein
MAGSLPSIILFPPGGFALGCIAPLLSTASLVSALSLLLDPALSPAATLAAAISLPALPSSAPGASAPAGTGVAVVGARGVDEAVALFPPSGVFEAISLWSSLAAPGAFGSPGRTAGFSASLAPNPPGRTSSRFDGAVAFGKALGLANPPVTKRDVHAVQSSKMPAPVNNRRFKRPSNSYQANPNGNGRRIYPGLYTVRPESRLHLFCAIQSCQYTCSETLD